MFDRELHKTQLQLFMKHWSEDQIEAHTDRIAAKYLTVKSGPNMVHLEYLGGMLDKSELEHLEKKLQAAALELSCFDKSGIPYANLQDYSLQTYIAISTSLLSSTLVSVGPNAAWDAVKYVTLYAWRCIKGAKSIGSTQKLNFGLKVSIGQGHSMELKLDGDFKEETALRAMDKAFKLLRETQPKGKPQFANFHVFDQVTGEWIEVDVMAAIREKMAIKTKPGGE